MKKLKVHFSSLRLDWKTPKAVYQVLDAEFHFDFDPCPVKPTFDGLQMSWGGCSYVNPPYGNELPKWIKKGYEEWKKGKTVVFLIPSRTDTRWWHEYCMNGEIYFICGRPKFKGCIHGLPWPLALVVFGREKGIMKSFYLTQKTKRLKLNIKE